MGENIDSFEGDLNISKNIIDILIGYYENKKNELEYSFLLEEKSEHVVGYLGTNKKDIIRKKDVQYFLKIIGTDRENIEYDINYNLDDFSMKIWDIKTILRIFLYENNSSDHFAFYDFDEIYSYNEIITNPNEVNSLETDFF
jgi:hypothetical protein